jgi:hypothetical protein
VVVAGAHAVEQGRLDLGAERLAGRLFDGQGQRQAAPGHVELDIGLVGQQAVLDDVTGGLAVHGDDLVTGEEAHPGSCRLGVDGYHSGQRHAVQDTGGGPTRPFWGSLSTTRGRK